MAVLISSFRSTPISVMGRQNMLVQLALAMALAAAVTAVPAEYNGKLDNFILQFQLRTAVQKYSTPSAKLVYIL